MKAEARASQDSEVSPTYSPLPASLYVIPDECPVTKFLGLYLKDSKPMAETPAHPHC